METDVVVIGCGATGTGIARDLSMRGIEVVLVEREEIAGGTTGHSHGLLHSGARYAVEDEESAKECIRENRILKRIASNCIRDTGGYFVALEDQEDYFEEKLEACIDCGIPAEEVPETEVLDEINGLSEDAERFLEVPDGSIDPVQLAVGNAVDADERGARIRTGAEVVDIIVEDERVRGVETRTESGVERISAEHVVNAAGAWSGKIGGLAGVEVEMRPTRGVMVVVDQKLDKVVNRCRPPSSGDIIVPRETTSVLGTTSVEVNDPDEYDRGDWEVEKVVEECAEMVPSITESRIVESYWGVRPLYVPDSETGRDASRDFFVLDHDKRDGIEGFTSVVGGKLTTYRLMSEKASDLVCEKLGVEASCSTDEEELPEIDSDTVAVSGADPFLH